MGPTLPYKAQWLFIYNLFRHAKAPLSTHRVYLFFLWFLQCTVTISLNSRNRLIFVPETYRQMDQVSHPYRTTGKIIVFYILIFTFTCSMLALVTELHA
jgi:hypothetical protein